MTSFVDVADALTQILPVYTAERLADHLTPTDVATLRDLVSTSVPANTLRAVASDLAYPCWGAPMRNVIRPSARR